MTTTTTGMDIIHAENEAKAHAFNDKYHPRFNATYQADVLLTNVAHLGGACFGVLVDSAIGIDYYRYCGTCGESLEKPDSLVESLRNAAQAVLDAGLGCGRDEGCPPRCAHDEALHTLAAALEA